MDSDGQRWTVGLTMSLCCCKGLGVGIGRGWTNTTQRDCDEAGTMNKAQRITVAYTSLPNTPPPKIIRVAYLIVAYQIAIRSLNHKNGKWPYLSLE